MRDTTDRPYSDDRLTAGQKAPGGLCPGCNQSRLKLDRKTGLCARCRERGVKPGKIKKVTLAGPVLTAKDWTCQTCGVPVIVGSERCRLHMTYQPGVAPIRRPGRPKRKKPEEES